MWSPCSPCLPPPHMGSLETHFPKVLMAQLGWDLSGISLLGHREGPRAPPHKDNVPSQSLAQHGPHGPVRGLAADLGKPCPVTRSKPPFRSHPWAHPLQKTAVPVPPPLPPQPHCPGGEGARLHPVAKEYVGSSSETRPLAQEVWGGPGRGTGARRWGFLREASVAIASPVCWWPWDRARSWRNRVSIIGSLLASHCNSPRASSQPVSMRTGAGNQPRAGLSPEPHRGPGPAGAAQ